MDSRLRGNDEIYAVHVYSSAIAHWDLFRLQELANTIPFQIIGHRAEVRQLGSTPFHCCHLAGVDSNVMLRSPTPSNVPCAETDWRQGGHYSLLSDGVTFWRREGPTDGVPIVLVHGATVPSWEFDSFVPVLLRAGIQVLRFDFYGHGASDRPVGAYTFERFVRQVGEVIEVSRFPRPTVMLGHSFGAAIVAAVAARYPQWQARLVLVAPMLDFNASSAWSKLFYSPVIGELAMRFIGVPALVRRRRRRYQRIGQSHLTDRFVQQVSIAGFDRGLLSMIRTAALGDQRLRYAALRQLGNDILLITGDHDNVIPPDHIEQVRTLLPPHSHHRLPAEHNLLLTHADVAADAVVRWLGAVRAPSNDPPRGATNGERAAVGALEHSLTTSTK